MSYGFAPDVTIVFTASMIPLYRNTTGRKSIRCSVAIKFIASLIEDLNSLRGKVEVLFNVQH